MDSLCDGQASPYAYVRYKLLRAVVLLFRVPVTLPIDRCHAVVVACPATLRSRRTARTLQMHKYATYCQ